MSNQRMEMSVKGVILTLLGVALVLFCGILGISLGVGARLHWLAPTLSWESASLLAAVAMLAVFISAATLINALSTGDSNLREYPGDIHQEDDDSEEEMSFDNDELEELTVGTILSSPIRSARRDWVVGPLHVPDRSPSKRPQPRKRRTRKK